MSSILPQEVKNVRDDERRETLLKLLEPHLRLCNKEGRPVTLETAAGYVCRCRLSLAEKITTKQLAELISELEQVC